MSDCSYWKKGQCLAYPAEIEPCKMVSVRCPTRLTLERDAAHAALADLREMAEGLEEALRMRPKIEGQRSKRDWDAIAAYDAWKKANP